MTNESRNAPTVQNVTHVIVEKIHVTRDMTGIDMNHLLLPLGGDERKGRERGGGKGKIILMMSPSLVVAMMKEGQDALETPVTTAAVMEENAGIQKVDTRKREDKMKWKLHSGVDILRSFIPFLSKTRTWRMIAQ
jgi:hypothetical protein